MFHWIWAHQYVFWPLASTLYLGIGTLLGLHLYWRYCRHHYEKHGWRGGEFARASDRYGCWCYSDDFFGVVVPPIIYISPVIWPAVLSVALISIPVKAIAKLYKRVETLANWDGKTVKGSFEAGHSTVECPVCEAKETLEEEIARRQRISDHS